MSPQPFSQGGANRVLTPHYARLVPGLVSATNRGLAAARLGEVVHRPPVFSCWVVRVLLGSLYPPCLLGDGFTINLPYMWVMTASVCDRAQKGTRALAFKWDPW